MHLEHRSALAASKDFVGASEGEEFISQATVSDKHYIYKGPYWAPYRCLYSRNVSNLFMAGRDISVSHEALGAVRVMRTCGCMGEIVGMAASICAKNDCLPRAVYKDHLDELKALMDRGAGKQRRRWWRRQIVSRSASFSLLALTVACAAGSTYVCCSRASVTLGSGPQV